MAKYVTAILRLPTLGPRGFGSLPSPCDEVGKALDDCINEHARRGYRLVSHSIAPFKNSCPPDDEDTHILIFRNWIKQKPL